MKHHYLDNLNYDINRVLTLLDRNKFSSTYGCFDRNYWHLKIKDFTSGMSQEFVFILAHAYKLSNSNNRFYNNKNLLDYVKAGIKYAEKSSNKDGSANDYYPFERALGATCFSLYAFSESCLLLDLDSEEFLPFFIKRVKWMLNSNETGLLSNHHAIVALSIYNIYLLSGDEYYKNESEKIITKIISWQNSEGWYPEYGGCSIGYLSVTIDFLAQYYLKTLNAELYDSLVQAIKFFSDTQHPDGTCGGDYDVRHVSIFHPNGFEIMGSFYSPATQVANSFLRAKAENLLTNTNDDYIFGHSIISNINAYINCNRDNYNLLNAKKTKIANKFYENSSIYICHNNMFWSIFNLNKGGTGKIYKNNKLIYSDAGIIVKINDQILISSLKNIETDFKLNKLGFNLTTDLKPLKQYHPNSLIFLMFRFFLFLFGKLKYSSSIVRSLLQKKLIYNNKKSGLRLTKNFYFKEDNIVIETIIDGNLSGFKEASRATELVPIYTAVSECFQEPLINLNWQVMPMKNNRLILEEKII